MSLYKDCIQVVHRLPDIPDEDCTMLTIPSGGQLSQFRKSADDLGVNAWYYNNVFYISDIHLEHRIAYKFPVCATAIQIKSFVKGIARGLFVDKFLESINSWHRPIVLFGGDIASTFELAELFYSEFIKQWDKLEQQQTEFRQKERYIYAVLGNHELWAFADLDSCYKAYQKLFEELGISFLNNSVTWFGEHIVPQKRIADKPLDISDEVTTKEVGLTAYEAQLRHIHNTMIVGGIGFAGYNKEFNANSGIYRETIDREKEIEETQKWEESYHKALKIAEENKSALIVLSHHPISDWSKEQPYSGCVYISGHTHRNYLYHDDDRDIHVFANNQIGYKNVPVKFKQAYIYQRKNPFASFKDGYHEINSSDYLRFYDYMGEHIAGNGFVERQIRSNNAVFYMVKHEGYYGFFLMSSKGAYICAGGRIKKIGDIGDIEKYDKDFFVMISSYMRLLSPYRKAQEQIAEAVRSFGGDGTIHGCIIDVDFFNHVMLNPSDGTVTYYTSPAFGLVKPYGSMIELLHENNTLLEREYKRHLKLPGAPFCDILTKSQLDITDEMMQIDIKNSVYAVSNRMNQLQRLFDKKILRDWNDELLLRHEQNGVKGLE